MKIPLLLIAALLCFWMGAEVIAIDLRHAGYDVGHFWQRAKPAPKAGECVQPDNVSSLLAKRKDLLRDEEFLLYRCASPKSCTAEEKDSYITAVQATRENARLLDAELSNEK